ncbi:MAG: hypothetical protein HQ558_07590, partial [Candidatus Omnitrophica bacterium]|nr:hypothetical protein [Candidatus Omnitrophota bacterium]
MDKRIVIIHPEGNILNNPSLSGMVEILCEKGYGVDIYSLKHKFYQAAPCEGSRLMLREQSKPSGIWASLAGRKALRWIRKPQAQQCIDRDLYDKLNADLIIGVDRDGISEASAVAEKSRAPYGFISFEILFAEETGKGFKEPEIKVCRNISFAVCQDELRSGHLSTENNIRRDKIIDIPVAGRGAKRGEKNFYLHDKLGIGHDKHIALYMGTVHNWSGTSRLLTSVNEWPDEWALVMHPRYGMDRMVRPFYDE